MLKNTLFPRKRSVAPFNLDTDAKTKAGLNKKVATMEYTIYLQQISPLFSSDKIKEKSLQQLYSSLFSSIAKALDHVIF